LQRIARYRTKSKCCGGIVGERFTEDCQHP